MGNFPLAQTTIQHPQILLFFACQRPAPSTIGKLQHLIKVLRLIGLEPFSECIRLLTDRIPHGGKGYYHVRPVLRGKGRILLMRNYKLEWLLGNIDQLVPQSVELGFPRLIEHQSL